jgi:hypothetical protein
MNNAVEEGGNNMKRLIFALSLVLLLLAAPGFTSIAYGHEFVNSSDQAQLMTSGYYRTVDYYQYHRDRYWRDEHYWDRPIYRYGYDPYYDGYYSHYPYTYYEPGFSIGLPFFYFHVQ